MAPGTVRLPKPTPKPLVRLGFGLGLGLRPWLVPRLLLRLEALLGG